MVDETLDWYLQNGPPNGNPSTTVGIDGNLTSQALDVHGQTVPGFPTAGNLVPAQINHSRGNGVFLQSPQESRLNVETRTPTSWGESRTFIEFDFRGCNNFSCQTLQHVSDNLFPRLRYAYGTLGGFLVGQANSNFRDADAEPEVLILDGPSGEAGINRVPQVRYTTTGPWNSALSFSAEAPETDVVTPAGNVATDSNTGTPPAGPGPITSATTSGCVANGVLISATAGCTLTGNPTKSPVPELTFAWYFPQPWGHVDFRLVGRNLEINDGRFVNRRFLGYGGGVSGDVKPGWFGWQKDDFQWQVTAGSGIGRYILDNQNASLATNYLAAPATAAAAANVIVKPIPAVAGVVGYQHWWLPTLRSNLAYSYSYYDYPSQLIGPTQSIVSNKLVQSAAVNLIWSPVGFIDVGLEYFWGQRQVVANIYGTAQTLVGKFRVKF